MKKIIVWGGGGLMLVLAIVWFGLVLFEAPEVKEGRTLFQHYCAHCHGKKGRGKGYNAKNMDPRPRDLSDRVEEYLGPVSNVEIYDVLSRDVKLEKEVTDPDEFWVPGAMPTFKYTLSDRERWTLVAFIRTLHRHDAEPIVFTEEMNATRPTLTIADPPDLASFSPQKRVEMIDRGKFLYDEKYSCMSCHMLGEKGGTVGPPLERSGTRLNAKWIYRWTLAPQSIRPETKMPSFGMPEDDALAITAYLRTLRAPASPQEP